LTPQTSTNQTSTQPTTTVTAPVTEKPKAALKLNKNQTFTLDSQTKTENTPNTTVPQINTSSASFTPANVLKTSAPGFQPQAQIFQPVMMPMQMPMMMPQMGFAPFPTPFGMPFNPMGSMGQIQMPFLQMGNIANTQNIPVTASTVSNQTSSLNKLLGTGLKTQPDTVVPNETAQDATNYSNEETKKLALKLAQKKQQAPQESQPSKEALQNAEREKKLLEEERIKAEEEAKKTPVVEAKNDGAADDASDDSASYKSEGEDLTKLPQERPKVIRYSKAMILDFVKKESKKTFEDDYRFENLIREIQKFNRKDHPGMFHTGGAPKSNNYSRNDRNDRGNYSQSNRGNNNK